MQAVDANDFADLLQQVAECYDRKPPSEAAAKMWFKALEGFMYPDVRSSLLHWIRTKSKAPTIAEILAQLNARKSDGIERSAVEEKRRFSGNLGPTAAGNGFLETVKQMLGQRTRDRRKWARDILASKEAGEPVSQLQAALAVQALGGPSIPLPQRERVPGEDDE